MVVVDSMRFPYIDGTANAGNSWTLPNTQQAPSTTNPVIVLATSGGGTTTANTIYSAQRLQPYRGGHAVPMPNALGTINPTTLATVSMMPPDPRYGYTEQTAAPSPADYTRSGTNGTYGQSYTGTGTIPGGGTPASTNFFYHTLGYINDSAENWDYLVFNDRDFSSVAELLLVPGCPPGLFTKQFVEFAASQQTAANIFSAVTPSYVPKYQAGFTNTPARLATTYFPSPFMTATVPFLDVSNAVVNSALGSQSTGLPSPNGTTSAQYTANNPMLSFATGGSGITSPYAQPTVTNNTPVLPHAFPYLVDKFFYTGASTFYYPPNLGALDPGSPTMNTLNPGTQVPVVGGSRRRRLVPDVRVLRGAQPGDGRDRTDRRRGQLRLGPAGHQAGPDEPQPHHRRGGVLRRLRQAERHELQPEPAQLDPVAAPGHPSREHGPAHPALQHAPREQQLLQGGEHDGQPADPVGRNRCAAGRRDPAHRARSTTLISVTDQTQLVQHGYLANDPIIEQLQIAATNASPFPGSSATGSRRPSRSSSGRATAGRATCSATAPATPGRTAPSPRRG